MTQQRQLKALVRARMEKTGESYMVARRRVLNARPSSDFALRGGVHPETAACANAFANRGIDDPTSGEAVSEALVLGIGGGLGAGYILWEFQKPLRRTVTTGFRNQWQYPQRWYAKTCRRLGIRVEIHETAGASKAAAQLDAALADGVPAIAFVSAADLPYWHFPADDSGWWGYPIVVYGRLGDRYLVDDRNHRRLTVDADELAAARARIPSYKHRLVVADPAATELDMDRLLAAIREGLADQVEHLGSSSQSFSLAAFAKWSKMLTSATAAKAWPRVFADGSGLLGALVSTHEAIDAVGILGGNLREMYAEFLERAAAILGSDLSTATARYREAAAGWQRVADVCLEVPEVAAVVAADRDRRSAVAQGDRGRRAAQEAARTSQRLMAQDHFGADAAGRRDLFARLANALDDVVAVERAALDSLRRAVS